MRRTVLGCAFALAIAFAASARPTPVTLPTEWTLAPPSEDPIALGTLPVGAAITADGAHLVVVEGGQATSDLRVFALPSLAAERTIPLPGAAGAPLADAAGTGCWASTAGTDTLVHVDAATGAVDRTIALPHPFWASAIARSPDGRYLAASGDLANAVALVDLATGTIAKTIAVGRHPNGLAFSRDGAKLYVANWGESSVDAIDVATRAVRATIAVGRHPEYLALAGDGARLFVSETDDDAIGIVDTARDVRAADVDVRPYGSGDYGASPTALVPSPDGKRLYVALSAANAIGVVATDGPTAHLAGAIPVGWYPTAFVLDPGGTHAIVADGKGERSHPNPQFSPFARGSHERSGYVAAILAGSLRRVALPDDAEAARGLAEVRAHAGPSFARATGDPSAAPIGTPVRAHGPIRHVVYVVRENRTYDQVLGDLPQGDGDPALTLFGRDVTPNAHALATRFGLLDDTFADAQVSADGHNWSMAAFANDYLERMWPPLYGDRRKLYDFEDGADAATPHAGYIWNATKRAGVALRNYGEFTALREKDDTSPVVSHMADLEDVTDPRFPGFDLSFSDLDREAEWAREFAGYVSHDDLPALEIVRLPNDHTSGTAPGKLTPTAYVAQNDLALGRLIDVVSHSRYWSSTAIFVVEDDAQNGPDHVGDQRMPALVVSPFARGGTVHAHHSTAGVLRTIELILGLPPLSAYDASALPLYDAFASHADPRPYDALPATADLQARNLASAYHAAQSARLDFTKEDAVPPNVLTDIVWHAVRGTSPPR